MDNYVPDIYQKSIFSIDYKKISDRGIKCMLFDIDNTLVPKKSKEVDESLKDFFKNLKSMGITPIIFSSNSNKRVEQFKKELEIDGYKYSNLHFSEKMDNILKKYKESEIAIIGDEMLTTIAYGNRTGITTILVNPLSNKESLFTKLSRNKERHIMSKLRKNNLFVKGRYYE